MPSEAPSANEGNVLFNDALNTFYLRLYCVRNIAKMVREKTRLRHMGYSFRVAARVLLCASSHRHDITYHGLRYTSRGALARTRNRWMGPPWSIDPTTHYTMSERSYHAATTTCEDIAISVTNITIPAQPVTHITMIIIYYDCLHCPYHYNIIWSITIYSRIQHHYHLKCNNPIKCMYERHSWNTLWSDMFWTIIV